MSQLLADEAHGFASRSRLNELREQLTSFSAQEHAVQEHLRVLDLARKRAVAEICARRKSTSERSMKVVSSAVDDLLETHVLLMILGATQGLVGSVRRLRRTDGLRISVADLLRRAVRQSAWERLELHTPAPRVPSLPLDWLRSAEATNLLQIVQPIGKLFPKPYCLARLHQFLLRHPVIRDGECVAARGYTQKNTGVFYTPPPLAAFIAGACLNLADEGIDKCKHLQILNPSCGCGGLLVEIARLLLRGAGARSQPISSRAIAEGLHGRDIDRTAITIAVRSLMWVLTSEGHNVDQELRRRVMGCVSRYVRHGDFLTCDVQSGVPTKQFYIVIGGPPFISYQRLLRTNPRRASRCRRDFESARKGQFDLYMVFVEKSLHLLRPGGVMAFSLPGSFTQSNSSQSLRRILSQQCCSLEVVQLEGCRIYPDAATTIAVLLAKKSCGTKTSRGTTRVKCLAASQKCWDGSRSSSCRAESELASRSGERGVPLESLPVRIERGITTGCDESLLGRIVSAEKDGIAVVAFHGKSEAVRIERECLVPILRGRDVSGYHRSGGRCVALYPYSREALLPAMVLRSRFPLTYAYLQSCRRTLQAR